MKVAAAAVAVALTAPGVARAAGATLTMREVPLHADRVLASTGTPRTFDLVGLHWRGSGRVSFSSRSLAGRWSPWRSAAPESEDQPDRGSPETMRSGRWRLGNPYWTG